MVFRCMVCNGEWTEEATIERHFECHCGGTIREILGPEVELPVEISEEAKYPRLDHADVAPAAVGVRT